MNLATQRVLTLIEQGWHNQDKVSKEVGLSPTTVHRILKDNPEHYDMYWQNRIRHDKSKPKPRAYGRDATAIRKFAADMGVSMDKTNKWIRGE